MKKFLGLVAVLAVTAMVSSSVFAATTTVKKTIVASASFSGESSFSFDLFKVSGDTAATTLDWTSPDAFVMGSTVAWVKADQYAKVVAKITKAGYAIYMNTDNKAANPNLEPNYTEWNADKTGKKGTEIYSGLVRSGSNGGAYRGYIPVVYSYVPDKNANVKPFDSDGKEIKTNAQSDTYLSDVSNAKYHKNDTTIAALNGPTFFTKAEDGTTDVQYPSQTVKDRGDYTAYMYFFGGFKDIVGGDTYTTSIKIVEEVE